MDHFICVVVRRRSLRANSVANLVNILSVYVTALYATLSFSGYPKMQHYNFIVPHTFRYAVENFDELNCQLSDDQHVLVACAWILVGKPLIKDPEEHLRVCFKFRVLRPDTIAMGISSEELQMLQRYLKENFTVSR